MGGPETDLGPEDLWAILRVFNFFLEVFVALQIFRRISLVQGNMVRDVFVPWHRNPSPVFEHDQERSIRFPFSFPLLRVGLLIGKSSCVRHLTYFFVQSFFWKVSVHVAPFLLLWIDDLIFGIGLLLYFRHQIQGCKRTCVFVGPQGRPACRCLHIVNSPVRN